MATCECGLTLQLSGGTPYGAAGGWAFHLFSFTIFPSRLFAGAALVAPFAGAVRSMLGLKFASIEKAVIWNVALASSVDTISTPNRSPLRFQHGTGVQVSQEQFSQPKLKARRTS